MADKRLRPGAVTACFFGEGAVGEGVFHESMNLAQLWKLPVLFVCENNLYAWACRWRHSEAETDIWRKAQAYRMPAEQVDGMDPVQMEAAARRAVERIRAGKGPGFPGMRAPTASARTRCSTPRPTARATRSRTGSSATRSSACALDAGQPPAHRRRAAAIEAEVAAEIDDAVAFAEAGTLEPVDELERFVLMDTVVQEEPAGPPR
jgi:pyruvate dehydrogenase E1 component alpha subunit